MDLNAKLASMRMTQPFFSFYKTFIEELRTKTHKKPNKMGKGGLRIDKSRTDTMGNNL